MQEKNSFQKHIAAVLFYTFIIGYPFQSKAAEAQLLMVDLSLCAAIEHLSSRLTCFDELAERQALAGSSGTQSMENQTPIPRPVTTVVIEEVAEIEIDAGADEDIQQFGLVRVEIQEDNRQEFQDQVTNIKILTLNKRELILSSGQVWRQMVAKRFLLREGDVVLIKKVGSRQNYQLSVVGRSGFIQVQRIE